MTDDQKMTIGLIAVVFLITWLGFIAYRAVSGEHLGK